MAIYTQRNLGEASRDTHRDGKARLGQPSLPLTAVDVHVS
jgi:hypothetical protein